MVVSPGPCPESTSSAFPSIDVLLTMPSCPKRTGVKRMQPPLPSSISSQEYRDMLLEQKRKQEEEQQQKEERKRQREEKKKERLTQAEEKKMRQQEKKKQRELEKIKKEKMKKKKMEEKELKALLAASQKSNKEESESSDSGEEPVYDDDSDACEDITDNCHGCGLTTRQEVRIKCTLCDKWWHSDCVTQMDLKEKSQDGLDAMDLQVFLFCFVLVCFFFLGGGCLFCFVLVWFGLVCFCFVFFAVLISFVLFENFFLHFFFPLSFVFFSLED